MLSSLCVCLQQQDRGILIRLLLSCIVQGLIQSAFLWGYSATQLLGGSLADKYGGRAVIAAGEGSKGRAWHQYCPSTAVPTV
jgi:MFS family permease